MEREVAHGSLGVGWKEDEDGARSSTRESTNHCLCPIDGAITTALGFAATLSAACLIDEKAAFTPAIADTARWRRSQPAR